MASSPFTPARIAILVFIPEGDEAWEKIVPSRGGFIWVQYNETYDVPYGISMFHGLHCLQMLRGAFKQQLGVSGNGHDHHDGGDISTKHEHGGHFDKVHLGHCLGYVAEMLQCLGDSTIERLWIEYDERTGDILYRGVDGTVGQHQCRDTRHLWAAAESTEDGGMRA